MNICISAVPGQRYLDRQTAEVFQVVSVDEDDRTIDVQYVDGFLDEKSLDEWERMDLVSREQSEDWVGPFDDLETDEIGIPEATAERHGAEIPMQRAPSDRGGACARHE